ncbi:hypothetical protein FPZ49_19305 [Paenibacillus cremeus]|uniref:Transcriptional regulator LacI/GalR-like sensor domain-containing protein n=1 Tax=Paenibacillus cremeus TaxID=2163881 RepID=A0A559K8D7_9BACL|nr:hypothetical protein FPZ49_19305 [Paenibacillus cremeus]
MLCKLLGPPLTTVRMERYEHVSMAAEILIRMIEYDSAHPEPYTLPCRLIVRGSTAPRIRWLEEPLIPQHKQITPVSCRRSTSRLLSARTITRSISFMMRFKQVRHPSCSRITAEPAGR